MTLSKWNWKTHKYDNVNVPDDWNVSLYSENMDELVNCPHCGMLLKYGDTFTSKEFHNPYGMGYGVCGECYKEEWERRIKEKSNEE